VSPELAERLAQHLGSTSTASHEALSDRELEVLKLIALGESLARIAEALHLSPNTVTTYRARICQKMQLKSNAQLTRYALEYLPPWQFSGERIDSPDSRPGPSPLAV
jgi:DNA-binding NarL/FixJ family response regulator